MSENTGTTCAICGFHFNSIAHRTESTDPEIKIAAHAFVALQDDSLPLSKELDRLLQEYGTEVFLGELGRVLQHVDESIAGHIIRQIGKAIEALAEI